MKKFTFLLILLSILALGINAQNVSINSDGSTPDPSAMLDVKSTSKGFLPPRIALTGSTDVSTISSPVAGLLVYNTSNTNDVTPGYYYYGGSSWIKVDAGLWSFDLEEDISTTYNVGIGTTAPQHKFVVAGNGWSQFMTNTDAHNPSASENYGVYIGSNRSGGATEGNIAYHNYLTFAKWDGTTYSETIRIDARGNVGIGTTTPTALLDVEGIIRSTTVSLGRDNEIWNSGDASDAGAMYVNHRGYNDSFDYYRDTHICDGKQHTITFFDGSSGYVGIGTLLPSVPLHVASYAANFTNPSGTNNGRYFNVDADLTLSDQYTSIGNVSIYSEGQVVTVASFVAASDQRVKTDVLNVEGSLDIIHKLRPVQYTKADRVQFGNRLEFGFIAQEVEEVLPEVVNTGKGEVPVLKPFEKVNFDDGVSYTILVKNGDDIKEQKYTTADPRPEGEIIVKSKTVNDFKSLSYDMIFTVAVGAIQEQQKEIEAFKAEIEALKAQNANLKAENSSIKSDVEALKNVVFGTAQLKQQ
jgi:predicted DNA-binding antitoxin AbrB/MazE fold protein